MSVTLKEVEIKADGFVVGHDKIMLNIDKNMQRHSHDGYSLLNVAMFPGLEVNPFGRTVKSENQDVLLCINGVEASQGEVRTLNPKDVLRIDFYTGYDPKHPNSRFTLDFIVKIRDYGGTAMVEATQHLNKLTGADLVDWRMFHGHTEFGVRLDENYDSYAQGLSEQEKIHLSFDRGDVDFRTENGIDRKRTQSLRVKPYLVWRKNDETLKLSFALQQQHNRLNSYGNEEYLRLNHITSSQASTSDHSDRMLPSFSGTYMHKFSNTRYLSVFLSGNYSHTNKAHLYQSLDDVLQHTRENFYSGSATVQYSFGFANSHNGFITGGGATNHSKIYFNENGHLSKSSQTANRYALAIGDNWRVSKALSIFLMLGGELNTTDNKHNNSTLFTFTPNLRVNWSMAPGNSLNASLSTGNKRSPMSFYSSDEIWLMHYLRQTGNPALKMSRTINASLTYRNVQKWGYAELFGAYNAVTKSVFFDFACDNDRDVYVQTFRNGGTYHDITVGPRLQFKLIPNKLTLRLEGEWNYVRIHTFEAMHRHTLGAKANIMYTSGGFTANINTSTPRSNLNELGVIGFVPWTLQASLGYSYDNFYFGLTTRNPFMTGKTRSRVTLPGVSETCRFYSPRTLYNMVALTVSYRFSYGKEKKKYDNVEIQESENSAILGL